MSVRLTAREKEKKDLFFRKINLALVEFEKKNTEISSSILLFKYPSSCATQNNKHVHIFDFVCMLNPANKRSKLLQLFSLQCKPCSYLLQNFATPLEGSLVRIFLRKLSWNFLLPQFLGNKECHSLTVFVLIFI